MSSLDCNNIYRTDPGSLVLDLDTVQVDQDLDPLLVLTGSPNPELQLLQGSLTHVIAPETFRSVFKPQPQLIKPVLPQAAQLDIFLLTSHLSKRDLLI